MNFSVDQSDILDTTGENPILKFVSGNSGRSGGSGDPDPMGDGGSGSGSISSTGGNIQFQITDGYDENSSISYDSSISLDFEGGDLSPVEGARTALGKIQEFLTTGNKKSAYVGTQLNRLSCIATTSQMKIENRSAAKSTIMDTDIAKEVANMTKSQILQQISVSVLSQSKNIDGQIVLSLIK